MVRNTAVSRWFLSVTVSLGLVIGLVAAPVAAQGAGAAGFGGLENPSGKNDRFGHPLVRPSNHTVPAPRKAAGTAPAPECPVTVHCVFVPAAYQQNDPNDPYNYGNYDVANRPSDGLAINQIVIHDTEGSLAGTLAVFQDPFYYVSSHYVIDTDGTIYQMVQNKNVAWHAGNFYVNQHSIGIEHVGFAADGINEYTPAMYEASAELVKYLAARYHIPLDPQHIIGHQNVPAPTTSYIVNMHTDPGPFWNWQNYFALLGSAVVPNGNLPTAKTIVVAPVWPLSKQTVTGCFPGEEDQCVNTTTTPTNFVYLHTAPSSTSPLITDPVLGQGSTDIGNTSAKAYYGQEFAVAGHVVGDEGVWYKVWYDGQAAWIYSPYDAPTVFAAAGRKVMPRADLSSIPVYGRAYPEADAYPGDFTAAPSVAPLPYTIPAGQAYTVAGTDTPTDYYHAWTFDSSAPYDRTLFKGSDKYIRIQYNGREAYVRAADVDLDD